MAVARAHARTVTFLRDICDSFLLYTIICRGLAAVLVFVDYRNNTRRGPR